MKNFFLFHRLNTVRFITYAAVKHVSWSLCKLKATMETRWTFYLPVQGFLSCEVKTLTSVVGYLLIIFPDVGS